MNSLFGISKKWCLHYDSGYNNGPLAILCYVVYATLGFMPGAAAPSRLRTSKMKKATTGATPDLFSSLNSTFQQ
jgi:hypothetical protein